MNGLDLRVPLLDNSLDTVMRTGFILWWILKPTLLDHMGKKLINSLYSLILCIVYCILVLVSPLIPIRMLDIEYILLMVITMSPLDKYWIMIHTY